MSYNEDRAKAIADLQHWLELLDHMAVNIRQLHEQGQVSEETMHNELAYLSQERELIAEVIEGLQRRQL